MEREEFGQTVRRWRDRVSPDVVGLPLGGRRRAVGLRREELAALAGISVDYLTRLEQGRATKPSGQVVEALARALRLSDPERVLLFRLSGQQAPGRGSVSQRIPPSVQRLLDRLSGNPIVVYDAVWNLIATNSAYEALTGASAWRGIERNGVWRNVVGPGPVAVLTPDELAEQQEALVGDLRMTAARYPDDQSVRRLVAELRRQSPRFAELWDSAALPSRQDTSRKKFIDHPEVGRIGLDCDTLVVAGDDLRIMVYSAEPGSEDADRLALAIVLGTQSLMG
ncbi:helix-turn-helix transcriptional regulator [Sinomonas terrae]|uniref:Helix-turn-helix transcriptional regulator n=1 Tax=Sinomonas terrae TaxID=2908838 RepID=A0ABS9TVM6_9MICC|nr:helix-turn-helix transcriptional regulator [Sinomonas terrae]MCH6468463.1 helix-turn-helix transcriptional regulator [Sinomonas terrae]